MQLWPVAHFFLIVSSLLCGFAVALLLHPPNFWSACRFFFEIIFLIGWKIRKIKIRNSLPDPVNSFNSNDQNFSSFHFQKQIYDFYLLMNWSVSSVILSPSYFSSPYFGLGIFELGGLVEQFEFVASNTLLKVSGQDLTSSVIIEVSCWIIWKCNFWKKYLCT